MKSSKQVEQDCPANCPDRPPGLEKRPVRFFVTIFAEGKPALRRLRAFDFDLFDEPGAGRVDKHVSVGGLLTAEQAVQLVENGYRVLLEEPEAKRARAQTEIGTFEEWLKHNTKEN